MQYILIAGFIDFIVEPSFQVMGDMLDKILTPLMQSSSVSSLEDAIMEDVTEKKSKTPSVKGSGRWYSA